MWRTETDSAFLCGSSRYLKIENDLNNAWTVRGVCWRPWASKHLICWWSSLLSAGQPDAKYTELLLDLKILLASQTLDENFKFHAELNNEEQKQILLSFVAVAGTSRLKMTSTTHGPFQASADDLGLPNTWSADGVRYSSAGQPDTKYTELLLDLKILLASQHLTKTSNFTQN